MCHVCVVFLEEGLCSIIMFYYIITIAALSVSRRWLATLRVCFASVFVPKFFVVVVGDRGIRWQLAWLLQSDYPLFRTTECSAAFLSMVVAILCFLVVCSFSSSHVFYVLFIC